MFPEHTILVGSYNYRLLVLSVVIAIVEVLSQYPRAGSMSFSGSRVLREASDARAQHGAASLSNGPSSVRSPPNVVVSVSEPVWRPVRQM